MSSSPFGILIAVSPARDYDKRRWSVVKFADLSNKIIAKYRDHVVFVGTADQEQYVWSIIERMPNHILEKHNGKIVSTIGVFNRCGHYNVDKLADRINDAKLLITVNTMTMHLASALNVPCVAIVDAPSAEVVAHPNVRQVIMPCTVDEVMEAVNECLS